MRRIEFWNGKECLMSIPVDFIPEGQGATIRECYETEKEIIVCGCPETDDESHNCDAMGCTTVNHVLYRFKKA